MGLIINYLDGQTPLDEDEKEGLLIKTIATRNELDEFEQQNIEEAIQWSMMQKFTFEKVCTEVFIKLLHKKMYGNVWAWAGTFRKTNKNIGVDKWEISTDLKNLLDDINYWIVNKIYETDEIALRFKNRLVLIHCFANGNGRHSRLIADIIISKLFKQKVFTWGAANLVKASDARQQYLKAIRAADKDDFTLLLHFARL
jgi:Fic-DOC domain mobile mystery protein B